jgi:hypothetical protein
MTRPLESCTWVQRVETVMPAKQTSGEKREWKIASRIAGAAMTGGELTVVVRSKGASLPSVRLALRPLTVIVQLWYESAPADFL